MHPAAAQFRVLAAVCLAMLPVEASALFVVNQPWLLPAASGQSTMVYMNLTSTDGAALIAVHANGATAAVLRGPGPHPSALGALPLPAQSVVPLAPGREHIALIKLKRTIKLGERLVLTLTIENADGSRQDITVDAEARQRSPVDDERSHHAHPH
jgi:periplasmic copper chaperone A